VYLADQVKRAGLQDRFAFVNEVSRIDVAYQHADILLLSSRLDPLPNVAVDAMSMGLPVVCFDKTTGIAALLTDHGLGDACVAPYLDIQGLASRVLSLVNDPDARERIGKKQMELSSQLFNMSHYVENIEKIALAESAGAALEKEDCVTISGADVLDRDFILPSWSWMRTEDVVRLYVRSWASGIYLRKPFAGFHPGMYLEQHGVGNVGRNPLADYLLAGKPAGPWLFEVINPASAALKTRESMRTALHVHIFYPDLARDIIKRLVTNTIRPDLLISVPSQNTGDEVIAVLRECGCEVADMQVVPNRGRDIGPLLTTFGKTLIHNYDLVGHLHSKKTATFNDSSIGNTWLVFLLENLLGGQHAMADKIISHMTSDRSLGLVFPDDPSVIGWAGNGAPAASLADSLGLGELPKGHFNFPVGTMFWARTEALRPLVELDLGWNDYPSEPLPYNGTMLHAIERLLPFVAEKAGYRSAVTQVPGVTR